MAGLSFMQLHYKNKTKKFLTHTQPGTSLPLCGLRKVRVNYTRKTAANLRLTSPNSTELLQDQGSIVILKISVAIRTLTLLSPYSLIIW